MSTKILYLIFLRWDTVEQFSCFVIYEQHYNFTLYGIPYNSMLIIAERNDCHFDPATPGWPCWLITSGKPITPMQ